MSKLVRGTIIENPDGSFQVPPRDGYLREGRVTASIFTIGALAVGVWFVLVAISRGLELTPIIFAPLALNTAMSGLIWSLTQSPVLKADATTVTFAWPTKNRQVPRSKLAALFRGHSWLGTYRGMRLRFYAFVGTDGRYRIEVPARWYEVEDVAEFANPLNLPMRGDFTQSIIRTRLE